MLQNDHHVLRVAIKRPFYKLLEYTCEISLSPSVGCRVKVPLGNLAVTAIVVKTEVETSRTDLKKVIEIIDDKPLLDASMMSLLTWASQYYFYPLGEVLFHALPVALRKTRKIPKVSLWKAKESVTESSFESLKRSPKQHTILKQLLQCEYSSEQLQNDFGKGWRHLIRQLESKELVTVRKLDLEDLVTSNSTTNNSSEKKLTLTDEQDLCVHEINRFFIKLKPKPILLHGITGSGKTEVYLRVMESILQDQKQILILVPEIGLTPQLSSRVKEYYPHLQIGVLHSSLADGERMRVWLGAKSGEINIVIGTRSAVFTPMKNLGAILIDEEHDASFKQQEGFLYQGRDMALKRAHDNSIPIVLGTATPSLESLYNVQIDRFHYLKLTRRPGTSVRPKMVLQDIRSLPLQAGMSSLMLEEIRQHLSNHNQVMIFLNRRGFAPVLMCASCGWHASCEQCDIGMTYHASSRKIICHHCGNEQTVKQVCPVCHSDNLTTQGQGTERIEEVLKGHFPQIPVIRVDRDSTSRKGSLEKMLEQVYDGKPVILIGTQMLSKGHDFPNLTLVGILDVDQALFSMDFRAQERLAQQIIQVAGRAGRGERKGRVVLQTSQPTHPVLINLLSKGYFETSKQILNERSIWRYPPFGAQALIRANSTKADLAIDFLDKLRVMVESENTEGCDLFGPVPSPLSKRAGRYRFQLLITSEKRGALHSVLSKALIIVDSMKKTGGIRWNMDVDPMDFL